MYRSQLSTNNAPQGVREEGVGVQGEGVGSHLSAKLREGVEIFGVPGFGGGRSTSSCPYVKRPPPAYYEIQSN